MVTCPVRPKFANKIDRAFEKMIGLLRGVIKTLATLIEEEGDPHTNLMRTELTAVAGSVIAEAEAMRLNSRKFKDIAYKLGHLLGYKPSMRIAEAIRELLIAIVVPARMLECIELVILNSSPSVPRSLVLRWPSVGPRRTV